MTTFLVPDADLTKVIWSELDSIKIAVGHIAGIKVGTIELVDKQNPRVRTHHFIKYGAMKGRWLKI